MWCPFKPIPTFIVQLMEEERRLESSRRAKGKGKLRMTWEEIAINAAVTDEKVIKTSYPALL